MFADNEFQIKQAVDVLCNKLSKRRLELACLDFQKKEEIVGGKAHQIIRLKEGNDFELGRKLVNQIKASKFKVQTAIQDE